MAEYSVEEARTRLKTITNRALMGEKIVITTGTGNAVVVSEQDWDGLVEAMCVLTAPHVVRGSAS